MKSVYKQTYDDYEYIIIDGLSTDNTIQVVNDIKDFFDTKGITIVISEKDHGIYDAMNKGAKIATGRYCCFMNAGDTFASPDVLAQLGKQIEDHNYTFVYGDVYSVSKTFKKHVKAQSMDVITNTLSMPYCHQALLLQGTLLWNILLNLNTKTPPITINVFSCLRQMWNIFKWMLLSQIIRLAGSQKQVRSTISRKNVRSGDLITF